MNEGTAGSSTPQTRRRRPKPQVSCNLCHRRKIKCDRGKPCQTCAYRGLSHSCSYDRQGVVGEAAWEQPMAAQAVRNDPAGLEDMQIRVTELEALLVSLRITSTGSFSASGGAESGQDPQWTAIMHRVTELKDYFKNQSGVSVEWPNGYAPVTREPAQDIGSPLPVSDGSTSPQQSRQAPATRWKKHPFPWMQHFYVPVTYNGSTNDVAPIGTG